MSQAPLLACTITALPTVSTRPRMLPRSLSFSSAQFGDRRRRLRTRAVARRRFLGRRDCPRTATGQEAFRTARIRTRAGGEPDLRHRVPPAARSARAGRQRLTKLDQGRETDRGRAKSSSPHPDFRGNGNPQRIFRTANHLQGRRGRCFAETDRISMFPGAAGSMGALARFKAIVINA